MKFVIRDDDLNYFSKPADIERWYADIFAQGIPVGFSTIPFVKPESDVYTAGATAEEKEYPVSENLELIDYVKREPHIEILQHGTTHETKDGYEYAHQIHPSEAKRGREELEQAFARQINVFVPPHDWIGSHGVLAVEASGMDVIRGRGAGLRNWLWRWQYAAIFLRMLVFRSVRFLHGDAFAYPYTLDFGKHREACSYRLEDADVFEGLDYVNENNGIFIVVTHLHFYTDEKKERLLRLIEKARTLGTEFVRPSALFS